MKNIITLLIIVVLLTSSARAFDANDLAGFAEDWLTNQPTYDYNSDGIVNFVDYAHYAALWQPEPPKYCPNLPAQAELIEPQNHATDLPLTTVLSWSVEDCNTERPKVNVWFGRHDNMTKVKSLVHDVNYAPALSRGFQYDWRIDTVNSKGTTIGTTWTFNTAEAAANQVPSANNVSFNATIYQGAPITLAGTDDGLPFGTLFYQIVSLPAHGYLQDPQNGNSLILANQLPYLLQATGNQVNFLTETLDSVSFNYRVWDAKLYSSQATVSVTVSNPNTPYLSFANSGYVVAANSVNQDIKSGWGMQSIFKTKACDATIVTKRDTVGKGWDLRITGGRLTFGCYDANGHGAVVTTSTRVNTGEWLYVGVGCKSTVTPNAQLVVNADRGDGVYNFDTVDFNIPNLTSTRYACAAQLVFASTNFDGSIARQRFFSGVNPRDNWNWSLTNDPGWVPLADTDETKGFGGYTSNLRWMMNDGAGTTVHEDKTNLNGSIIDGNSPYWHEPFRYYYKTNMDRANGRITVNDCDCNPVPRGRGGYRSGMFLKSRNIN